MTVSLLKINQTTGGHCRSICLVNLQAPSGTKYRTSKKIIMTMIILADIAWHYVRKSSKCRHVPPASGYVSKAEHSAANRLGRV